MNPHPIRLRVLLLEDSPEDAERTEAALAAGDVQADIVRVENEAGFRRGLADVCPDLVLADYSLPAFDGVSALRIARETCPDVPLIFVSGALGEELAIETIKLGATDYVLKHRLERLAPAVRRALREREDRETRARLEAELRARADELAEADRRKDEFLSVLAHELRNPLAPIFNALGMMEVAEGDADVVLRARRIIERQTRHMARLLDDLLDIARIGRGKVLLRREALDLAALVRQVTEDHRSAFAETGVMLEVRVPDAPLWSQGDPTRLAQVIGNLLGNAGKFTPRGGRVRVTLAPIGAGDEVELRVEDTGRGIAPEAMPHVFEPFAQELRSLDLQKPGLGLGLALVRGLVRLHGGSVTAESDGDGKGTTIVCRLPVRGAPGHPAEAVPSAEPPRPEPSGRRILVVDDNQDAADTLRDILALYGHAVEVAYTGPDAVAAAGRFRPEVVLCDVGLPGFDGCAVAQKLRQDPLMAEVRLIAISGYGRPEDRRRTREAGFDCHLTKPVDPLELQSLISTDERGR